MAKPFKNPVNGILPGFQVPEAVQLTFSKRYRVVVMYASLVCFLSQHLNLLQRFLHIFTYFSLYTTCLHDLSLHFCRPSYIVSLLHGKPLQERGCVFGLFFEMYSKP